MDSALTWLPSGIQSIAVLQAPLTYDLSSDQLIDPESCYQIPMVSLLLNTPQRAPYLSEPLIRTSDVSLVVQTSGQWRCLPEDKTGFRAVCSFTFFNPGASLDAKIEKFNRQFARSVFIDCGGTVTEIELGGLSDGLPESGSSRMIYRCIPWQGVVVCANDKALMHFILSRHKLAHGIRMALPASRVE